MKRIGWVVTSALLGFALSGCSHPTQGSSDATPLSTPVRTGPPPPSATADVSTWGKYLAAKGKLNSKGLSMRPYIYVVPGGSSSTDVAWRDKEKDVIAHSVGPILIPGGWFIVGGPNSDQTSLFIDELGKALKPNALNGITVIVVGNPAQDKALSAALKPTGASLRFVAM